MVRKTKADAEQTRQKLLDAAELLFLKQGVSQTSLQHIATAAGTTRGAVYWHFHDKADLFNAMMERVVLPLEQAFQQLAETEAALALEPSAAQAMCPLQHLLETLQAALHATVHDPQTRRVFTIATHRVEYVGELQAVATRRLQIMEGVVQAIEKAIVLALARTGRQLAFPARSAALSLHMQVDGLINHWLLAPEAFDLEEVGRLSLINQVRGWGLA